MGRISIYEINDNLERVLVGWFDPRAAIQYDEGRQWDGRQMVSMATGTIWDHEILYRTKGGRWVLHSYSQYQGSTPSYEFVTEERARDWLILNGRWDDAREWWDDLEDESGPGRPEIGPAFTIRLPVDLRDRLDAAAKERGLTRAALMREILEAAL